MKITYLYHSGFCVELEEHVLIFDYVKGSLPEFHTEKKVWVFISHKHADHFSFKIFSWKNKYKDITYFMGSDISLSDKYLERKGVNPEIKSHIVKAGANKEIEIEPFIKVRTLRSTDAGVAFIVEIEGKRFYHAGDLNWWHWDGENKEEQLAMEKAYKHEIDKIAGNYFDVAFVPLDPRLGKGYSKGMDYFLETTNPKLVYPMHMWGEYEWVATYKETEIGRKYAGKIME